jgi:hypothetical protein
VLDDDCPEAREPFHFSERHEIEVGSRWRDKKMQTPWRVPRRAGELSLASEEPTGYVCPPELSQAIGLISAHPLD